MYERLYSLISNYQEPVSQFSAADIDEVMMITEAIRSELPARFVQLAYDLEKAFDADFPQYTRERFKRLTRILDVAATIPIDQTSISDTRENDVPEEPTFKLEGSDKARVFELCNQIRKIIFGSDIFDQPHKRLLLNRVAAIEYQVEQPKGKLDVLRAGVSEVGETLGKFGTDIEPLTKRIKEVFQIGRSNSDEYAQIPAPDEIKQLPAPEEEDE